MKENKVFIACLAGVACVIAIVAAWVSYDPKLTKQEELVTVIAQRFEDVNAMNITSYECKTTAHEFGRIIKALDHVESMFDIRKRIKVRAFKEATILRKRCSSFTGQEIIAHHREELMARIIALNKVTTGHVKTSIEDTSLVYRLSFSIGGERTPEQLEVLEALTDGSRPMIELATAADLRRIKFVGSDGREVIQNFTHDNDLLTAENYRKAYVETLKAEGIWLE